MVAQTILYLLPRPARNEILRLPSLPSLALARLGG